MKATDGSALRIGAWRVDPALDEMSKDGNTVKLERRAMQLLLCLSKHADQVVSVEQLLDEVWAGVVVTPDSVYHAVAALRRLLGDDTKQPTYIANVPRRGYRLVAKVAPWSDAPSVPVESSASPALEPARATPAVANTGLPWRGFAIVLSIVLAIALGYVLVDKLRQSKSVTAEPPVTVATMPVADKSIAVLPFIDLSEKKDQEYFSDGMAEEILDLLAKIPGLQVPARTSSFYFKGKSEDIPTIARRLMVAHVLEGSVRKSGNHVRITVQLVKADNGYHVWSETYDRTLDDIFKVQDEIAGEVVKALKVPLAANEASRTVPTRNSEAHALLLKARFLENRATPDDMTKAISYYRQALQLDADSAAAWAGLSKVLTWNVPTEWQPKDRAYQQQRTQALQAAERAIAIDPKLGEAHEAMAEIRYWYDFDWAAADAEVEKARALDPANSHALVAACVMTVLRGQLVAAARLCEEARSRDPLYSWPSFALGRIYYVMGQFTEAEAAARKGVELTPTAPGAHTLLAQALFAQGQQDAALAEIEKDSDEGYRLSALARIYIVLGHKSDADAVLAELEKTHAADYPRDIATLHALRGEIDQAFQWLDRAYDQRDSSLIQIPAITVDPDVKNLRGDPRYKAFLRKMNLPE